MTFWEAWQLHFALQLLHCHSKPRLIQMGREVCVHSMSLASGAVIRHTCWLWYITTRRSEPGWRKHGSKLEALDHTELLLCMKVQPCVSWQPLLMRQNHASNSSSMNALSQFCTTMVPTTYTGLIVPTRKCPTGEELILGKGRPVHVTTPAPDLVLVSGTNATATKMIIPGVRMKAFLPIKKTCPLQRCVLEVCTIF